VSLYVAKGGFDDSEHKETFEHAITLLEVVEGNDPLPRELPPVAPLGHVLAQLVDTEGAAIGQIESGDGANVGPSSAGAEGPMQFLPSTWQEWGITAFGEPGPPDVMDPYDAVPSAARYLCAAGAGTRAGLARAIFAYNHADWYVAEVLALAQQYARVYG
jgi:membrane-bound lytic murein transglycosylase B